MDEEMKMEEKKNKATKEINPLDYVTITVKEYRKLLRKIERMKIEKEAMEEVNKAKKEAEDYRRWWHEEEAKVTQLKESLEDAKNQIKDLLGINKEDSADDK